MKKVFVSSTFQDMQQERDALHNLVMPSINKIAKQYGDYIDLLDLRWGVNTSNMSEEEACQKVVDACLNVIDNCRPYMIGILGDRYGWIPDDRQTWKLMKNINWEPICNKNPSITALEIEYGALRDPSVCKDKVLFYRRIIDGKLPEEMSGFLPENKEKIEKLIEDISKHYCIKEYHVKWDENLGTFEGIDDFAQMVTSDLVDMMQKDWEEFAAQSPIEQEFMRHKNHFLYLSENLVGNSRELAGLVKKVQENRLLVIAGDMGVGKTSLACMVGLSLKDSVIVPYFCGLTQSGDSAKAVAEYIIQYISEKCGYWEDATAEDDIQTRMAKAMMHLERFPEWKICILIDGIDTLPQDTKLNDLAFVPAYIPQNVRFVLTAENPALITRDHQVYIANERSAEFQKTIIKGYLQRKGKELPAVVIHEILSEERPKNSLYIKLLIQRLCMLQGSRLIAAKNNDEIVALELETIRNSDKTLKGLCKQILDDAGNHLGCLGIKKLLQYLAVAKRGITFFELQLLLHAFDNITVDDVDYWRFTNYMDEFVYETDSGRIRFREQLFKDAILEDLDPDSFAKMQENILKLHQMLKDDSEHAQDLLYYGAATGNLATIADFIVEYSENWELAETAGRDWLDLLCGCDSETAIKQIDLIYQVFSHPRNTEHAQYLAKFVHDHIHPIEGNGISEWLFAVFLEKNVSFAKDLDRIHVIRRELAADIYTDASAYYLKMADTRIADNPYRKAWELLTAGYSIYKDLGVIQTDPEKRADYYYKMARILSDTHVFSEGNFKEANKLFIEAASIYEQLLEKEPAISLVLSCIGVYQGICTMCHLIINTENSKAARYFASKEKRLLEKYKYLFVEKTEMWDQLFCITLINAGAKEKDPAEAMKLRKEAVEQVSKFKNVNNFEVRAHVASAYSNLASSYEELGDIESLKLAAEYYEIALRNGIYLSDRINNYNSRVMTAKRVVSLLRVLILLYRQEQAEETLRKIRGYLETARAYCGMVFNAARSVENANSLLKVMLWTLDYGGTAGLERIEHLQSTRTIIEAILKVEEAPHLSDKLTGLDMDAALTYLQTGTDSEKLGTAEQMQIALICYEEAVKLFWEIAHKEPSVRNFAFLTESLYRKARHPEGNLSEIEFKNLKAIVLKMYEAGNRDPFLLEMRDYVMKS